MDTNIKRLAYFLKNGCKRTDVKRHDARGKWVKRETGVKSMKKEKGLKIQGNGCERETNEF